MNQNINAEIHWLVSLAGDMKDPYKYPNYEQLQLASHPFALEPAFDDQHYPICGGAFLFFGSLNLDSSSVSDFQRNIAACIMTNGFFYPKGYYLRKITIQQPPGKQYPPIFFYEIKTQTHVYIIGGMTTADSEEIKRLERLFQCLMWIYSATLRETTIQFSDIRLLYTQLKSQVRAHQKKLARYEEDEYYDEQE